MTGIAIGYRTLGLGVLMILLTIGRVQADTYKIDQLHSKVGFSITHIFTGVDGRFNEFSGRIVYDAANPDGSSVEAVVTLASIDTDNEGRDGHLKSPDFFHVEEYPEASFKSTSVKLDGDILLVTGDLTIRGVTKSVVMPVEILGVGTHPMSKAQVAGFSGSVRVKRSDFGVNHWADEVPGLLSDDVTVSLSVEAVAVTATNACNPCTNPCNLCGE